MKLLTQAELKHELHYDPQTGLFHRAISHSARFPIGSKAGSINSLGYVMISILGTKYAAHRLAWLYVNGRFPDNDVDHKNGVRSDNRICNLRDATRKTNLENQRQARTDNKSTGILGVYKVGKRYRSIIQSNGKSKKLGYFSSPEDAQTAYIQAKREIHQGCTI